MREGTQDVTRFDLAAGGERQSFQADHCVAAPVGEPVIAGDNAANFVSGGTRARRIFAASHWCEHELIGCPNQFLALVHADCRMRFKQ